MPAGTKMQRPNRYTIITPTEIPTFVMPKKVLQIRPPFMHAVHVVAWAQTKGAAGVRLWTIAIMTTWPSYKYRVTLGAVEEKGRGERS